MALQKQTLSISLNKGIDTKTDPKQVLPGKLTVLENATFQTTNELRKRNGFTQIGNSLSTGNAIASANKELVVLDGSSLYSYSASQNTLNSKGTKIAVDLSVTPVVSNTYQQTNPDSSVHLAGYSVFAWNDSQGGVRYSVFDNSTNQSIVTNASVSTTGTLPKVKSIGAFVVIFYIDTGNVLKFKSINTATPTVLSSSTTIATIGTSNNYDAENISTRLFVAYADSGNQTSIVYLDSSLVVSSIRQVNEASRVLCVFGDPSNNVWLGYSTGSALKYFIRDFNLSGSPVLAPTLLESVIPVNIAGIYNASTGNFFYEIASTTSSASDQFTKSVTGSLVGAVGSPSVFIRSVGLASKAFVKSSNIYLALVHQSTLQPTYFVVNSSKKIVCKIAPSIGGGLITGGLLPEVNNPSSGVYSFTYLRKQLLGAVSGEIFTLTGVNNATLTFDQPMSSTFMGNNLHVSGGVLSFYDGQITAEHGFHLFPEDISDTVNPSGGGLKPNSSYQYCAVYEWTDLHGQIQRSAPSIPITAKPATVSFMATLNSNDTLTNVPYSLKNSLFNGMIITGAGIDVDSVVIAITDLTTSLNIQLNRNTTLSTTETVTATSAQTFTIFNKNTNVESKSVNVAGVSDAFRSANFNSGSTQITISDPQGLRIGGTVTDTFNNFIAANTYITAISGNTLTLNNATISAGISQPLLIRNKFTADTVSGSPVLSNISAQYMTFFKVGYTVTNDADGLLHTIVSIGVNSVTIDINLGYTTTASSWRQNYQAQDFLKEGQVLNNPSGTPPLANIVKVNFDSIDTDQLFNTTGSSAYTDTTYGAAITIPTIRLTEKTSSPPNIVVYRTVANGTIFYKNSSISAPIYNDVTVDSALFEDNLTDSQIIGNDQLYTTGGEIENISAPAISAMTSYKNRLIGITEEDPLTFWYSKEIISGTPVEFSDLFTIRVEEKGDNLTSLIQMDDKLILFKKNSIFYMVGDGPTPAGTNNDFTNPQIISSDCGCSNKRSVVSTPSGIMFQSTKGIYLLERSLQVQYIGADVESYNSDTVTSALLIEGVNQVRFTMASGVILVYDYYFKQWSVFTNQSVADACIFQDLFTYISTSGVLLKETPGVFLDQASAINMRLVMSWLSLAQLQGYQRVYKVLILGEWKSKHNLIVKAAYDFLSSSAQTTTIPVLTAPSSAYQYRVFLARQKCESLQIEVQEQQLATFGEGLTLSAFGLEVGVKQGLNKVPAAVSYG